MPHHILIDQRRVLLGMLQHMRTRAYHGHIAQQDVHELRELIQIRPAQEIADPGLPGIILDGLQGIGLRVHLHRTKFKTFEVMPIQSRTFLLKQNRAG